MKSLIDLFDGRSQLLVYHFMFAPDYTAGCAACSAIAGGFNGFVRTAGPGRRPRGTPRRAPARSARDGSQGRCLVGQDPLQIGLFCVGRRDDLRLFGRRYRLRELPALADYLRGFSCGMCAGSPEAGGRSRLGERTKRSMCRDFTGATGLEPATSGVTDRKRPSGPVPRHAGTRRESRAFHPLLTGDLRAPAGVSDDLVRDVRGMEVSLGDVGQGNKARMRASTATTGTSPSAWR